MPDRKALMLCYYFPPIVTSGVARSLEFARRLPEFGWQPLVLTVRRSRDPWVESALGAEPEGIEVRRTLEWNLAGLVDFLQGVSSRLARVFGRDLQRNVFRDSLCVPDAQIAWLSTLAGWRAARECALVYASCSPFSSALSAALIKRLTGRPLVLDFRDAWTLNPHARPRGLQRALAGPLERFALAACDALVVNTEGAARRYAAAYPQHRAKIVAIPNGYDALTPVPARPAGGEFVVMHVGSFYGARSPDALLECLAEMGRDDIVFVQVGRPFESCGRFEGRVRIRLVPPVPRAKALELMREASLLYLKQGREPGIDEDIAVGAKTYEYLATGLPILAEVPPGDNAEVVRRYASNGYVVTTDSLAQLRRALEQAYAERSSAKAQLHPEFVRLYSRHELTRRLAELFDRVARP